MSASTQSPCVRKRCFINVCVFIVCALNLSLKVHGCIQSLFNPLFSIRESRALVEASPEESEAVDSVLNLLDRSACNKLNVQELPNLEVSDAPDSECALVEYCPLSPHRPLVEKDDDDWGQISSPEEPRLCVRDSVVVPMRGGSLSFLASDEKILRIARGSTPVPAAKGAQPN